MGEEHRRQRLVTVGIAVAGLITGLVIGMLLASPADDVSPNPTPSPTVAQVAPSPTTDQQSEPTPTATGEETDQTEAGALAAALGWMRQFTPALYLDDDARTAAVREVAAADAEADLQTITANIADSFRAAGVTPEVLERSVRVAVPAGYQIRSFSPEEAEVAIWLAQVVHIGEVAPLANEWDTQVTTMRWERDAWRLVSVTSTDGPAPDFAEQGDGQLEDTLEVIESFTEFDYGP